MNKLFLYLIPILFVAATVSLQGQETVTKPESGQSTYIITSGNSANLQSSGAIILNPGVHIQAGATFTAQIAEAPIQLPDPEPYTSISLDNSRNYVLQRTYQERLDDFGDVINEQDVIESLSYLDGLGRPQQQLALKASHDRKDLVTQSVYDPYGRQLKTYLPAPTSGTSGSYRGNTISNTNTYYASNYPEDMNSGTLNPYSEVDYEASPLNRTLRQAAPGHDWRMGGGHEIALAYESNGSGEVLRFKVSFQNGDTDNPQLIPDGDYNAGELFKTVTKDENWSSGDDHTTQEFTDQYGRVVLKRTFDASVAHDTYYVYDDFDNLSFVIPPKVTANNVSPSELNELCYQYKYDHRNRLIEKKIPGKDWEYIVYNKLDQPILTQDPNLRANNQWLFTKYDAFGRVAYTGLKNANLSRTVYQSVADDPTSGVHYESQVANNPTVVNQVNVYYSNNAIPIVMDEAYTINYYDDYAFADTENIALPGGNILGQAQASSVKGLPTGSKVRVLGTDDWITTVTLYDVKGRPICVITDNEYLNTRYIVASILDFAGKTIETVSSIVKGDSAPLITKDTFTYDHAARLLTQHQELNGQTELIVSNTYDGIGQLVTKEVGNTYTSPLQTVDYSYNVRGWLKSINDPTSSLGNDLFAFEIDYNEGSNALYNGNIAKTAWKTANDNVLRDYRYTYDALNRIKTGISSNSNYNLTAISYDKNGNITSLNRKGHINTTATTFGIMDDLTYTYDSGNKLLNVLDEASTSQGFKDMHQAITAIEYNYDANGNMISDSNKHISSISYNHLNLPTQVVVSGGGNNGNIQYIYDATGVKLKKIVSEGSSFTATEYCGNYVYEQLNSNTATSTLQFFNTAEGYVEPDGSGGYDYIFQCKDHLGNIRLSYSDTNDNGSIATSEIREENNYYPFGLKHKGYNQNLNGRDHNWDYLGQEEQSELGLNWLTFRYRNYIPEIGRFFGSDPISEQYYSISNYQFAHNSPIWKIELEGLEGKTTTGEGNDDTTSHESIKMVPKENNAWAPGGGLGPVIAGEVVKETTKKTIAQKALGLLGNIVKGGGTVITALLYSNAANAPTGQPKLPPGTMSLEELTESLKGSPIDEKLRLDNLEVEVEGESDSPIRRYEKNLKHGVVKRGDVGAEPTNPEEVLKTSIELPGNTTRRIGADSSANEFVVFDEHLEGVFHGHVRSWSELTQTMQAILRKAGLADKKGRIIDNSDKN